MCSRRLFVVALVIAAATCQRRGGSAPTGATSDGDFVVGTVEGKPVYASEIREPLRQAMAWRLFRKDIEPLLDIDHIPEAHLRALYDRASRAYVHGRLVEVGALVVFTGSLMKPKPRAEREKTAQDLAAYVAAHPSRTPGDFERLAGDPAWANRKVTYRRLTLESDFPLSQAVGGPVQKLRKPGDTTGLISDDTGFYIARYIGEKPPLDRPFDEVRREIAERAFEPWRASEFLRLTHEMGRQHDVVLWPERLLALSPSTPPP